MTTQHKSKAKLAGKGLAMELLAIQTDPARNQRIFPLRLTATDRRRRLRLFASQLALDASGSQFIGTGSRSLQLNRK